MNIGAGLVFILFAFLAGVVLGMSIAYNDQAKYRK